MLLWLSENLSTIIVAAVVAAIVAVAVYYMYRAKKRGEGTCGCNCKNCSGACHLNQAPTDRK